MNNLHRMLHSLSLQLIPTLMETWQRWWWVASTVCHLYGLGTVILFTASSCFSRSNDRDDHKCSVDVCGSHCEIRVWPVKFPGLDVWASTVDTNLAKYALVILNVLLVMRLYKHGLSPTLDSNPHPHTPEEPSNQRGLVQLYSGYAHHQSRVSSTFQAKKTPIETYNEFFL